MAGHDIANDLALKGRFIIPSDEVKQLQLDRGITTPQQLREFLMSLVGQASELASPPISKYKVGCVELACLFVHPQRYYAHGVHEHAASMHGWAHLRWRDAGSLGAWQHVCTVWVTSAAHSAHGLLSKGCLMCHAPRLVACQHGCGLSTSGHFQLFETCCAIREPFKLVPDHIY